MIKPPMPANELERLKELKSFRILENERDVALDELVKIAAQICNTEMSFVSLVEADQLKLKSKTGGEGRTVSRELSFCTYTIASDDLFIIEDATLDERFKDNPMIVGEPNLRFYAEAPLKTSNGYNIGTLCVLSREPKSINESQKDLLKSLARQVVHIFEIHRKNFRLQQSRNELNHAQEISHIGSWNIDLKTGAFSWSEELYRIFEISSKASIEEIIEKSRALVHPEDLSLVDFYVGSAKHTFKGYELSYRLSFDNGRRVKYILEQGKVFMDSHGDGDYLIRTIRDRTPEIDSELKYKDLLLNMHEGLVVHAEDGTIVEHNQAALDILGLSKDQLMGKTDKDPQWHIIKEDGSFFSPDEFPSSICMETKKPVLNVIMGVRTPLGKISWISTSAIPHITPNAKQVIVNFTNITKFVEATKHKLEVEHMHYTLMQGLDNQFILVRTDTEGKIIFANNNFCKISKYREDELIGQDHRILNSGVHSKEFFKNLWETIKSQKVWSGDICNRAKDGTLYWVQTKIFPETDELGEVTGYFAIRYDITDKKQAELELENERERSTFAAQLAAVGEMSAGIAHEIANPLAIISGQAELLKIANSDPAKVMDRSDKIIQSVFRINKIIKGLHYLSQKSRDEAHANYSLDDILANTLEFCSEALRNKDIKLEIEKPDAKIILNCNDIKISQILLNLINNAKDAILEAGCVERWIKIKIKLLAQKVEISVIDSGPGIPQEIKEKLGQSFVTTKPIGKGTGLGISLIKRFVSEHHGEFTVNDSCENTCFLVTLPIVI